MIESQQATLSRKTIMLPGDGGEIVFAPIPAGTFRMGQRGVRHDEEPVHSVEIPEDYYLGVVPVTQRQLASWTHSSAYRGWFERNENIIRESSPEKEAVPHRNDFEDRPENPADQVTWWEAVAYAEWLNEIRAVPEGLIARLPTESEWERACRGGTETAYWSGNTEEDLDRVGWYGGNAKGETHPVGEKPANVYGLHDVHGNCLEWCCDFFDPHRYRKRVEGSIDHPLDLIDEIEFAEANPQHVAWAEMMNRFSEGAREVRDQDRRWLHNFQALAECIVGNGDDSWKEVLDGVKAAQSRNEWPEAANSLANQVAMIFQGLVDQARDPARVLRGGDWDFTAECCRSAFRFRFAPGYRYRGNGFRLALVPGSGAGPVDAGGEKASTSERSAEPEPQQGWDDAAGVEAERGSGPEPERSPTPEKKKGFPFWGR